MKKNLEKKIQELEKRIAALEESVQVQPKEITIQIDSKKIGEIILGVSRHNSVQESPRQGTLKL